METDIDYKELFRLQPPSIKEESVTVTVTLKREIFVHFVEQAFEENGVERDPDEAVEEIKSEVERRLTGAPKFYDSIKGEIHNIVNER